MENILNLIRAASKDAKKCQRNWDLGSVIHQDIQNLFKDIAKYSPTKQSDEFYEACFVSNRNCISEIFANTNRPELEIDLCKNSQTLAPFLIIFGRVDPETARGKMSLSSQQDISIGIACGQIVLAANILGLRTGFCACFNADRIAELTGLEKPSLIIGIGYPDKTKSRNTHQFLDYVYDTHEKNFKMTEISDESRVTDYRVNKQSYVTFTCKPKKCGSSNIADNLKTALGAETAKFLDNERCILKEKYQITESFYGASQLFFYSHKKKNLELFYKDMKKLISEYKPILDINFTPELLLINEP